MDKLKPLLENKFWIFLFLAILLPTIGWFVASGTFAEEIEKREADLKKSFDSLDIQQPPANEVWTQNAKVLVEDEQARLDKTSVSLWETQKKLMDWPAGVQDLMVDVPYEGTIPPRARENYRGLGKGYEKQLVEFESILEPYDPVKRTGKVLIGRDAYTHVPIGIWKSGPPTSQAMWNAQIDAWLVRSIFRAIKNMNKGNEKLSDSTIVQVLDLRLRGGIRDYSASMGTNVAAGTSATSTGSGGGEGYADSYTGSSEGGYSSDANGGLGKLAVKLQFDLSDELGPDAGARGGTTGSSGEYGTTEASTTTPAGATGATAAAQGPRRYVDDDATLPFRTRGFVLGVVMNHRYLNDFLAELSGSDFPIQVLRVHQQINNPDQLARVGRTGSRTRGGSGSGYPSSGFGGASTGGFGGTGTGYETSEYGNENETESAFGGSSTRGSRSPGSSPGGAGNDLMVKQALSDPNLATVWIGGLITLFKPVEQPSAGQTATAPESSAEEAAPPTSTQTDPTAAETVPENSKTPAADSEKPADPQTNPKANTPEDHKSDTPQPASDVPQPAPEKSETAKSPTSPE
jgi:hypothetical protein